MTVKVLFVCLGNICRSPTAHGVFQTLIDAEGLSEKFIVDSAGTAGWHVGKSPDSRATASAAQRGFDLADLKARQVTSKDFSEFDYILAMDKQNLSDLQSLAPANHSGFLELLLTFNEQADCLEVPDPYYGGQQGFEDVLDLVEGACAGLLQVIRDQQGERLR